MEKCCFAGHNDVYGNIIRKRLFVAAEELILKYGIKVFWVGNYGAFDRMAVSVLNELKKIYSIKIELIIPYLTKEIIINKDFYQSQYDSVCLADISSNIPAKFKIAESNKYMVDNSEYLICFVEKEWGGAAKTLKYAEKKKKKIINIAKINI